MMVLTVTTYFAWKRTESHIMEYSTPLVSVAFFFQGQPVEVLESYLSWGDLYPPVWYS